MPCQRTSGSWQHCLGSAGNGEATFPVSVDSAPFGAGIFKALGVYRPMTRVEQQRVSHEPHRDHFKTDHFLLLSVAPVFTDNLAPGSVKSDDRRLTGPGASPSLSSSLGF